MDGNSTILTGWNSSDIEDTILTTVSGSLWNEEPTASTGVWLPSSRQLFIPSVMTSTISPVILRIRHPSLVEPSPDWPHARHIYGWAWDLHVYPLGSLFAVVAFYSLMCILQLCRLPNPRPIRCFFSLLHFLVFLFGSSRAVFLFLDPYNQKNILPQAIAAVFLHLSFPCLTSAFCMVLAALVRTTKMKLMKSRIINLYLLLGILITNFALAIAAEVVVDLFLSYQKITAFAVASQTYFIAWSLGLGMGYLFMFSRLIDAAEDADGLELSGTRRISVGVKITVVTAILLLLFAALHIYGLIAVYGFLRGTGAHLGAWEWYGFHVGTRITELLLAALIAFVASLIIWTKAARMSSAPPLPPARVVTEDNDNRQVLLNQERLNFSARNGPPSPGVAQKNRRDFPVTFNPEGGKGEDGDLFMPQRFAIANRNRAGVIRKVDSHLLETNPIHNDQDRYG